jgi:hypothetical protein
VGFSRGIAQKILVSNVLICCLLFILFPLLFQILVICISAHKNTVECFGLTCITVEVLLEVEINVLAKCLSSIFLQCLLVLLRLWCRILQRGCGL